MRRRRRSRYLRRSRRRKPLVRRRRSRRSKPLVMTRSSSRRRTRWGRRKATYLLSSCGSLEAPRSTDTF